MDSSVLRALQQLAAMPPPLQPPALPAAAAATEFELPSGMGAMLRALAALHQSQANQSAIQIQSPHPLQSQRVHPLLPSLAAAAAAGGADAMPSPNSPHNQQLLLQLATQLHLGHTMATATAAAAGPAMAASPAIGKPGAAVAVGSMQSMASGAAAQAVDESSMASMLSLSMCALARHQKESLAIARSVSGPNHIASSVTASAAAAAAVAAAAAATASSFTIACLVCGDVSSGKHYGEYEYI